MRHERMLIGGAWTGSASGRTLEIEDPATGTVVATAPVADPEDLERALAAAVDGFAAWRSVPGWERSERLRAAAARIRAEREAIAAHRPQDHITLEMAPLEIRHRSVRPISAKHAQASRFLQQSPRRSPMRPVSQPAGMLLNRDPIPIKAVIKPARATEAPNSRALRAITGRIAPLLTPYNNDGPKAGMAIERN